MARLDARARKHSTRRVRRRYDKAGGVRSRAWRDAHFPSPLVGEGWLASPDARRVRGFGLSIDLNPHPARTSHSRCKASASQLENGGRAQPTSPSPTRGEEKERTAVTSSRTSWRRTDPSAHAAGPANRPAAH